jgi:hypothetical protein
VAAAPLRYLAGKGSIAFVIECDLMRFGGTKGIDFVACDVPKASRLLLHIMAAVAENEAKAISDRTIAALQQATARGTALGATNPNSRNLTDEARAAGAKSTHLRERGMTYADLVAMFGEPRSETTSDMGPYARPIRTLMFACGCCADNVAAPDRWTDHREACRARPSHSSRRECN